MTEIEFPSRILIGERIYPKIPNLLDRLDDFKSLLLVMGVKTRDIIGQKIVKILNNHYSMNFIYAKRCDHSTLQRAKKQANIVKADLVLGIGGGKNIDLAKSVAHYMKVPYISIPTILYLSTFSFHFSFRFSHFSPPILFFMRYLVESYALTTKSVISFFDYEKNRQGYKNKDWNTLVAII